MYLYTPQDIDRAIADHGALTVQNATYVSMGDHGTVSLASLGFAPHKTLGDLHRVSRRAYDWMTVSDFEADLAHVPASLSTIHPLGGLLC